MSAPTLRSARFRSERERHWRELEGLVARVEREGVRGLSSRQMVRLPVLYRTALAALSVARSISLDRNVIDYLESLSARAFTAVYGTRHKLRTSLARFFRDDFPETVRRFRWHVLLAALLLLAGGAIGFELTRADPERYFAFIDAGLAQGRTPLSSRDELREPLYFKEGAEDEILPAFATFLFTHNAQVGILCFTFGAALGLPVVLMLLVNGMMLGAMSAIYHAQGLATEWWAWLLPHGITEMLALVLCGAGGLVLGQAVAFPGEFARVDQLKRQGRAAAALVVGAMAMLLFAGLVEGIFRQVVHAVPLRYGLAGATALFWPLYFLPLHRLWRGAGGRR